MFLSPFAIIPGVYLTRVRRWDIALEGRPCAIGSFPRGFRGRRLRVRGLGGGVAQGYHWWGRDIEAFEWQSYCGPATWRRGRHCRVSETKRGSSTRASGVVFVRRAISIDVV